jgi:hypothetical protein
MFVTDPVTKRVIKKHGRKYPGGKLARRMARKGWLEQSLSKRREGAKRIAEAIGVPQKKAS